MSVPTAKTHISRILAKLAFQTGLVTAQTGLVTAQPVTRGS
jgi:hypothetical protein